MNFKSVLFFLFFFLFSVQSSCTDKNKCRPINPMRAVRDIENSTSDNTLNIYVTPKFLLVKGAKAGAIKNGKFTDSDGEYYAPLMEAVYSEFSQRSNSPYRNIIIYVHEKLPASLVKLVHRTVLKTSMAPVTLMPFDFLQSSCKYSAKDSHEKKCTQYKIPGSILIRQEKNGIYVDGVKVVPVVDGKIPAKYFDKNSIILIPLKNKLSSLFSKNNKLVPVLHITYDADTGLTKYILLTAGKVGIFKIKTLRVLP